MANRIIVKKTVPLGKIAYRGNRKVNAVDVEIEVRERGGEMMEYRDGTFHYAPIYTELSICGNIWNARHTDIVCGGQCIDVIAKYLHTPKMQAIYSMWEKFHLNGMKAGTVEQESAIKKLRAVAETEGIRPSYETECEYLKRIGMYEVEYTGKSVGRMYDHEMYRYGTAWLVRDLPDYVIEWAKSI